MDTKSQRWIAQWVWALLLSSPILTGRSIADELNSAEASSLRRARMTLADAAIQYRDGDYATSSQSVKAAIDQLTETLRSASPDRRAFILQASRKLVARLRNAHVMLQLEGQSLPPIRIDDGTDWLQKLPTTAETTATDSSKPEPSEPTADSAKPSTARGNANGKNAKVSFSRDVAALLIANCNGCHVDARQVRGGLRLDTFAGVIAGGDSGDLFRAGNGQDSLLVQRLRGEGGDRMPGGGRPALPDASIDLISRWIDQGAEFDGGSRSIPLATVSRLAWANGASSNQITERRTQEADRMIRLVAPSRTVSQHQTEAFLLLGPVPESRLKMVGQLAEKQLASVRRTIAASPTRRSPEGYFRGKAVIFVLDRQYDYSEFTKMVEQRSLPADRDAHFRYDGVNAYAVVRLDTDSEDDSLSDQLAEPMIGLAMATRGSDVPQWFSEGVARAIVNTRVRRLDRATKRALRIQFLEAAAATKDAKQFLEGRLQAEQLEAIATAIGSFVTDSSQKAAFSSLVRSLNSGEPFDASFAKSFGGSTEAFVDAYLKTVNGGAN